MLLDLLCAARWLRKNPLFTVAVIAILGLGVGANTAVFSVVDAVLLRALPFRAPERLVEITETGTKRPLDYVPASDFGELQKHREVFAQTEAFWTDIVTLTGTGDPQQLRGERVTPDLFSLLGVHPRLGVLSTDTNRDTFAVLSDRLWRRLFRADPAVLGRTLTLSGEIFTITAVMPPNFEFPDAAPEIWIPLHPAGNAAVHVVARLAEGITLSRAQSAAPVIARQLRAEDPKKAGLGIAIAQWRETVEPQYRLTLVLILAAVALVLLIGCVNVGSLLLSRAVQRQKEIAIRASLGASAWRVTRQLMAEGLVLAALGSAAGIGTAWFALRFLSSQLAALPIAIPNIHSIALNQRVLGFNAFLCLAMALICSLAPILLASRTDLQSVLRGSQASSGPKGSSQLFSILIGSEAAFAILLLIGSGLMLRSLIRLEQSDHGFHPDHVLTMRVPIGSRTQLRPTGQYGTKALQAAYYHQLLERLSHVPGVKAVAVVNNLPLSGSNTSLDMPGPDGTQILNSTRTISPQYFSVMGIPLIAGRVFTEDDQTGSPPVVILNEYLAKQLFPGRNPIGQSLSGHSTVVGVVRDTPQSSYELPPTAELYMSYRQLIFGVFLSTIVVRTESNPVSLAAALRREVWSVDPNQPILKIETMDDVIAESIWRPRFSAWLFSVLGGLALLLTCAGIYGVVAYTSALRVREAGIRIALGAGQARIAGMILRGSLVPLSIGLALGVVAALLSYRLIATLLYQTEGSDPLTYTVAAALLLAMGVLASAGPAWRATTRNPVDALRAE